MSSLPPPANAVRVCAVGRLTARPVSWLWPAQLGAGKLAMLDGDPGLGKSLLALDLCARLGTGLPFPDGSPSPGDPGLAQVLGEGVQVAEVGPKLLDRIGPDADHVHVGMDVNAGGVRALHDE